MKTRLRYLFSATCLFVLIFISSFSIDQNPSNAAAVQATQGVSTGTDNSQRVVIRFYYDNQAQLDAVAGQLDIWEVHPLPWIGPGSGYAIAAVLPSEQDWLQVLGYRVEADPEKTALLQAPASILDPRYYYFDNFVNNTNNRYMVDFLQSINAAYPNLTELIDIGDAWQGGHSGHHRDMWVLRISNEDPQYGEMTAKPTFFMMANIHAREVTTPEMAIRYIKYMTSGYLGTGGYGVDPDVTWLVDQHATYVLVTQNPDGRAINELDSSAWWRKNVDPYGCLNLDSLGIDLNRNSSFKWGCCGGSNSNPCNETYRGPSRASEPETAAFQAYAATIFQDWNGNNGDDQIATAPDNASGMFITLHSYADDVLWPWGFAPGAAPNDAQLQTIGRKLADLTGTMVPTGGIGYLVDGSSDDWIYGKLGIAAFTYEIGPNYGACGSFFPAYGCQDGIDGMPRNFWAEMKASLVYANKIAATPYITSYGPDAQNLVVSPNQVPLGSPATLTGMIIDQRYPGDTLQPVAGAEYFVDYPGTDGSGTAMAPTDGNWGSTSEGVTAALNSEGLSLGRHIILVHGKNDDGVWGPFSAVFFTVLEPLQPIAEFSTNSPVELGMTMVFTNETSGAALITFAWDFGDGVGGSNDTNPSYVYIDSGTYSVTLVATNTYGVDSVEHSVSVGSVDIASVDLTLSTSGTIAAGDEVEFTADLSPDNAQKPYDYTIDFGDGTVISSTSNLDPLPLSHIYLHGGTYPVVIAVLNETMTSPATDTIEIKIFYSYFVPISMK